MKGSDFFDVAVIGGGPAGLLAAGVAAQQGGRVVLLEKNDSLGQKLLLTGGTRCNLTNLNITAQRLVEFFGPNGKFLFSGLSVFGVAETLAYFQEHGLQFKEEAKGCIFAQSDKAHQVLYLLQDILYKHNVTILTGTPVLEICREGNRLTKLLLPGRELAVAKVIIATGGVSFPSTGSTGDGFLWAQKLGHTVVPLRPGLAPLYLAEGWVKGLQGISLPEAPLTILQNNKKIKALRGDILFTERGVTGPLIHSASRLIGDLLAAGPVSLALDLLPSFSAEELDAKLQKELPNNKRIRNYLETLLPKRLVEALLAVAAIDPEKICNTITRAERLILVKFGKALPLSVIGLAGYDKAMITAGGVSLKEIDAKTMRSKLIENLYFAGEVLDLDGPSGGYNLQVCWITGYLAGLAAAH